MKNKLTKPLSARFLPAFAAVTAAGFLCASSVSAQYIFTNWDHTDNETNKFWSNDGNWNQPTPPGAGDIAWINYGGQHPDPATHPEYWVEIVSNVGSVAGIFVGQGAGFGEVRMLAGGSLASGDLNIAHDQGRDGTYSQSGGSLTLSGNLNAGQMGGDLTAGGTATVNFSGGTFQSSRIHLGDRNVGSSNMTISGGTVTTTATCASSFTLSRVSGAAATANSSLTVTGGVLQLGALNAAGTAGTGALEIGHEGGDASVEIAGGTVWAANVQVANLITSTANGSLTVTGGTLNAVQIGVGSSGAGSSGVGDFTIGGDATVNTVNHIFLRADGRGNFTVNGSDATININRPYANNNTVGFEVSAGSVVNFNADAGGFSTVNMVDSNMFFSSVTVGDPASGILNVDTAGIGLGIYDLFTFREYRTSHGIFTFGTENITGLLAGQSAEILYNSQSIQLNIIPEPSTYAAIFGGLAFLGAMIRRRFRK